MPDYLLEALITFAEPIFFAVGTLVATYVVYLIRRHVPHAESAAALERAVDLAEVVVGETQQTIVQKLKDSAVDGKLTRAEAKGALTEAVNKLKLYAGPKGIDAFRDVVGRDENALDKWLVGLIEAEIDRRKRMTP